MIEAMSKPIEVPVLRYYMQSALMAGEKRHPQDHLTAIGVKWRQSECHSVGDCWFFWMPYGNLEALPEWLEGEIIMVDPIKFWGNDNEYCVRAGQKVIAIYNEHHKQ
jgi:hypothetical protein